MALETELGQLRTATLQREATAEVDAAIKDGVPILSLRDHYIARFMRQPEEVRSELSKLPRLNSAGGVKPVAPQEGGDGVATLSALDLEIARNMGTDPAKLVALRKERAQAQQAA